MENRKKTLQYLRGRRVAVLKGGWSAERRISLKTGEAMEAALKKLGLKALGLDVNRRVGEALARKKINFAFIGLHGPFGEDGSIQGLLEVMGIPYTGSGVLASALCMDKVSTKKILAQDGLPTPPWVVIERQEEVEQSPLALPVVVKPVDQGSAIGVSIARSPEEFFEALSLARRYSKQVLVEKFILGREVTVGILGEEVLPVTEILPQKAQPFYNFKAKYAPGGSKHIVPAELPLSLSEKLQKLGLAAFRSLGCRAMGRVDLMMDVQEQPFILEMNTVPGMTNTSLLPEAAKAAGYSFEEMLLKIVEYSLK